MPQEQYMDFEPTCNIASPAFCRILYSMRQKAGEEPGNEATSNT